MGGDSLRHVDIHITPEPTAEEREVITAALRAFLAEDGAAPGAWWQAGVRESVSDGDEQSYAAARPRRTAGAARA